eukprot:SM000181S03534  [mRNA]  locus=s181:29469:33057:+ [translate_table: standard]
MPDGSQLTADAGIYTHPHYGLGRHPSRGNAMPALGSFISASYVKMVESAGGQAVPVFYDSSDDELEEVFGRINMLLFTGGFARLGRCYKYFKTAQKLFKMALAANDRGDYFPVHGTCLGLELLMKLVSSADGLLKPVNAVGQPAALEFASNAAKRHRLFAWMSNDLLELVQRRPLTMETHRWGLLPEVLSADGELSTFFEVLTTSRDADGKEYVSTVAGVRYPVSATQWHAEKHPYEWYSAINVPHCQDAILVTQSFANFIVSEARKNEHYVPRDVAMRSVVDNWPLRYTALVEGHDYDQMYFFPKRSMRRRDERRQALPEEPLAGKTAPVSDIVLLTYVLYSEQESTPVSNG